MSRLRCEYVYSRPFGNPRHSWRLIGALGGIELHISGPHKYEGREEYSAGLEMHYRAAPDYKAGDAPSHDHCWLLKCPCWHDGTSLYAQEHYVPLWFALRGDHDAMFDHLQGEYRERFARVERA